MGGKYFCLLCILLKVVVRHGMPSVFRIVVKYLGRRPQWVMPKLDALNAIAAVFKGKDLPRMRPASEFKTTRLHETTPSAFAVLCRAIPVRHTREVALEPRDGISKRKWTKTIEISKRRMQS